MNQIVTATKRFVLLDTHTFMNRIESNPSFYFEQDVRVAYLNRSRQKMVPFPLFIFEEQQERAIFSLNSKINHSVHQLAVYLFCFRLRPHGRPARQGHKDFRHAFSSSCTIPSNSCPTTCGTCWLRSGGTCACHCRGRGNRLPSIACIWRRTKHCIGISCSCPSSSPDK